MKNWLSFRAALALSLVASLLALAQPAHAEKRVALVIGNNDYKNVPKLQKAHRAGPASLERIVAAGVEHQAPAEQEGAHPLIHDQRKILDMTATGWLSFREFNGLLVHYTQLMSYRCAIREVRVGTDTAVPDKVLKMPPCDPSVMPHDAKPYLKLAPSTQFVSVELTYRDGSVSEIKSFRR
jgi:hypothetical protein